MRDLIFIKAATGPFGAVVTRIDRTICMACAIVLWISFFALFLPTLANAILRYTTDASLTWTVELVKLTFPWFIMAGAVLAAQHSRHIGVEFFLTLLPKSLSRWLTIPVQLLIILASASVIYVYLGFGIFDGGIEFAAGDTLYTSLNISQSWSYTAILCGYISLCITALTNVYRQFNQEESASSMEQNTQISL